MADPAKKEVIRDENGRWLPGTAPPGGKPVGGRAEFLRTIDKILNEPEVAAAIYNALREELMKRPMPTLYKYIYPLLPKNVTVEGASESMRGLYLSVCSAIEARAHEQAGQAGGGVETDGPSV